MERTIVVGDVHGCLDEVRHLMLACGHTRGDRLVFVGDLVAKGPDSQGVVQLAREEGARAVMGNHDARAVQLRSLPLTDPDWAFLQSLPLVLRLGPEKEGDPDTAVIHAGALAGVPLEQQREEHLITLRSITTDGKPSKWIDGTPWASLWTGPERLVFGHDAIRGLQQHPMATGLDTGCVYGRQLTALLLPERRIISVPARRAYEEPKGR
jgi:hypothetical protein